MVEHECDRVRHVLVCVARFADSLRGISALVPTGRRTRAASL